MKEISEAAAQIGVLTEAQASARHNFIEASLAFQHDLLKIGINIEIRGSEDEEAR